MGWTKDVDNFLECLSAINFSGGGFCDAAIAEGLAEVLMMFPSVNGIQNHQRHCILVAASNPYPLPTPVYIPPNYIKNQSDGPLSDAETVAQYFKQSLVSLSVICPRQLPKLKSIYNAAKRNPSETDPIHIVKIPNYLVLISENFMEARTAFTQPEITNLPSNQSPIEMEVTPVSPALPAGTSTTNIAVNDNVATKVGPTQQTSSALQSAPLKYAKLWEGDLTVERQGKSVHITKLQCYRSTKTSESLAEDWPLTMQVDRVIPEAEMKNKDHKAKVDYLVFRAMNDSNFLGRMQEKKLSMVIELPSQTLLLSVSADRLNRMVGMVLPRGMVLYKVTVKGQEEGKSS